MIYVIDASAMIAYLRAEPGGTLLTADRHASDPLVASSRYAISFIR